MQYIIDNKDEAKEMGDRGRAAVEKSFNWSVEEKKLLITYSRLLDAK
jgi:glycosyltransferase involved in cell wall biosynthesis